MTDTFNKPKLNLRTGGAFNGDNKTPSPATKLLINHGKPNFTIQRSPKAQQQENGGNNGNPLSTQLQMNGNNNNNDSTFKNANINNNTNNDFVVQSTKFNGVFKPSNISIAARQPHQESANENEAAKVVLRRTLPRRKPEPAPKEEEDDSVPEFIRRQRRIQERLAKENVLDFENRRSGYFTHVIVTPNSTDRTSFMETMSSPAIVPSLEIPPPAAVQKSQPPPTPTSTPEPVETFEAKQQTADVCEVAVTTNGDITNGHNGHSDEVGEEEVAKAIEEVNKAVAGEDDDIKLNDAIEAEKSEIVETAAAEVHQLVEEAVKHVVVKQQEVTEKAEKPLEDANSTPQHIEAEVKINEAPKPKEIESEAVAVAAIEEPITNGHVIGNEVPKLNGESNYQNGHVESDDNSITISHTNGFEGPTIPKPDPSGALGVNYEPKTVVSFSKDLGSEPNKYPDTVQVTKTVESNGVDSELQELAKLKFDIKTDEQDVQVTPVLRVE